ncbi:hydroxyurea phosphotransferase [Streptomyces griseoluteus]|uniref:hydroxyurea phosphotransferase n=1 Tax=Streptomyces griseoluteus TaxID=29306 RepID=UPI0034310042
MPTPPSDRRAPIRRADRFPTHWSLRADGPSLSGIAALVLPVTAADGTPAALKVQHLDEESAGEPTALLTWAKDGAVHLPAHDPPTGTLLRNGWTGTTPSPRSPAPARRSTSWAHCSPGSPPTPPRRGCADRVTWRAGCRPASREPSARNAIAGPGVCWGTARPLRATSRTSPATGCRTGTRTTATSSQRRASWPAIGPEPPAGNAGFELLPALADRYDPSDTRRRFDALTAALGPDRERARAWTPARVLQNRLWQLEEGEAGRPRDDVRLAVGRALRAL